MDLLSPLAAQGNVIELSRSDPRHLSGSVSASASEPAGGAGSGEAGFGKVLFDALNGVNRLQLTSSDLTQAMITDPDSVDIHDVTVAMAEANLALSMTKAIMDRAIRAYQSIVNLR